MAETLPTEAPWVICGPGENAGVIDIGDGQAAIFKMESHNHPSFIEPYQGAATGVGGIMRDVFTMGARPVANLNALRQSLAALDPAQELSGILFDVSSKVAGRNVTQSALETIASSARISLEQQSGVDLDSEAANLIRFQQAFQASGRAMQAASDIFDTLLGIGR